MAQTKTYQARKPHRSVFHDLRGIRYHVNEWGDSNKPLLVMLHGWGDCGTSFQFLVDELQEDWYVIAPDWRGFGKSYCRAFAYWFPDYVADLDALLKIYQPEGAVNLLGHSMGANVSALYAGTMPERVAAFINVEGFGLPDSDPQRAPDNYRRWIEQGQSMPTYQTYAEFDELAKRILKRSPCMGQDKAIFVALLWAMRNDDGRVELRADPAHKLPNAVQYRRAEAVACRAQISSPLLQVLGSDTSFREAANAWLDPNESAAGDPVARTEVIRNAGHMVHFEQPAELAAVVEAFLHKG
ncbi:MAG: pimeloyl-ACP methyl ester carboxylesterase [Woeseiaceae bacterium]